LASENINIRFLCDKLISSGIYVAGLSARAFKINAIIIIYYNLKIKSKKRELKIICVIKYK